MDLWTLAVIWLACATVGALIAQRKNRNRYEGFALGLVLGLAGIAIEALLPTELPAAPSGRFAYACPRCNAVQNLPNAERAYECWQCHHKGKLSVVGG